MVLDLSRFPKTPGFWSVQGETLVRTREKHHYTKPWTLTRLRRPQRPRLASRPRGRGAAVAARYRRCVSIRARRY